LFHIESQNFVYLLFQLRRLLGWIKEFEVEVRADGCGGYMSLRTTFRQ